MSSLPPHKIYVLEGTDNNQVINKQDNTDHTKSEQENKMKVQSTRGASSLCLETTPPAGGQPLSKEGLKLQCAREVAADPTKTMQSHALLLGWGWRCFLSHRPSDDADAVGPGTADHGTHCKPRPSGLPFASSLTRVSAPSH